MEKSPYKWRFLPGKSIQLDGVPAMSEWKVYHLSPFIYSYGHSLVLNMYIYIYIYISFAYRLDQTNHIDMYTNICSTSVEFYFTTNRILVGFKPSQSTATPFPQDSTDQEPVINQSLTGRIWTMHNSTPNVWWIFDASYHLKNHESIIAA